MEVLVYVGHYVGIYAHAADLHMLFFLFTFLC